MGIVVGITWGSRTPTAGLQLSQRFRRQDIKLSVKQLKLAGESGHLVTAAATTTSIKLSSVVQQLHVLSPEEAHAAYPGGWDNSQPGSAVVVCNNLADVELLGQSWEQVALLCTLADADGKLVSALCQ